MIWKESASLSKHKYTHTHTFVLKQYNTFFYVHAARKTHDIKRENKIRIEYIGRFSCFFIVLCRMKWDWNKTDWHLSFSIAICLASSLATQSGSLWEYRAIQSYIDAIHIYCILVSSYCIGKAWTSRPHRIQFDFPTKSNIEKTVSFVFLSYFPLYLHRFIISFLFSLHSQTAP